MTVRDSPLSAGDACVNASLFWSHFISFVPAGGPENVPTEVVLVPTDCLPWSRKPAMGYFCLFCVFMVTKKIIRVKI